MAAAATGTPYCWDPNCPYCKELREIQELVKTGRLPIRGETLPVGFRAKPDSGPVRTGRTHGESGKS